MHISEYQNIYTQEASHFYYSANHEIVLSLLRRYTPDGGPQGLLRGESKLKILDAGCGTGLLAKKLGKYGDVVGLDLSDDALSFARKRGVKVKKGSISMLPFKTNEFDVLISIDVINHLWVKDELKAFREFYRVLKPGGLLIMRVSANPWLRLKHDEHVLISHRYSKDELKRSLNKAKFKILKLSFVNLILLPPAALISLLERLIPGPEKRSGVGKNPVPVNWLLKTGLGWEKYYLKYADLPLGLGLIAVGRKPLS
ncbi:MAG: Methyltransferase type 11 [Candidatus Woesebacteria bacterium GW2011_GWB1_38_5b]|uniref:Methyltransferase type 11 domain-containing protein n=3 Tax=Microgenomates group TaxID=1794810 RepID=A0A1F5K0L2_9BACT|nr:MAG: Methyltransferase type 11 [Candidatus Woesebacteria bacterium GW2011_GWB1_38_5b]OGE17604.1 MAG: hypothetical protein A2858_02630 [Candidatus Daviesbacteria bacterium RIFCSPHIGHO2_01_FULL_36_37]OGE31340.1 MAG: hypothetical protein A3C99_03505 [Candidatus Daviesbacteria bacterium RIFCSPHIGHO2_02_FULL_37_9]OGE34221.1 MAG: hypothetical protein A3E66_02655 [Candidatus Daviesbacteria bacterium RIFCSPHIGHO2_12_FULL_37_16]